MLPVCCVHRHFFANGTVTGQGDSFVANVPRPLPTLAALGIVQVACGESHNAALTIYGRVFTWGRGKYGALGLGTFDSSSWPQHVAALQEPACQVTTPSLACLQLLVCNCLTMLCSSQLCIFHPLGGYHAGCFLHQHITKHCCNVVSCSPYTHRTRTQMSTCRESGWHSCL